MCDHLRRIRDAAVAHQDRVRASARSVAGAASEPG
jgi:hypothetical protein